jgi:hypothetical protein
VGGLLLFTQWASMTEEERGKMFQEYMTFTEDIKRSGHWVGGDPLQPTTTATTVRVRNGRTATTDGPFAETREQLGGYYLIDGPELDAALSWAARCPGASHGAVEVRPIWTM